ncbi:MAG: hypothetical protein ABGY75_21825 [Gemmataceae bacterium]
MDTLVCGNILLFTALALTNNISGDPSTIVFIDFWGRFTVYSLWFVGYSLYRKYVADTPALRWSVITLLVVNIPAFLLLSFYEVVTVTPATLAIIDFWGRLTVYSLWFMLYELYRTHLARTGDGVSHAEGVSFAAP